jgi:hypothetical protein
MGFMLADERRAWLGYVKARSKAKEEAGPFDSAEVRFVQDDGVEVEEDTKNNR